MSDTWRFCPQCAAPLAWRTEDEDGGPRARLRCTACDFTHWNNPTPVLAAIVQLPDGRVLIDSYHCSRYNVQTKRLSMDMLAEVFTTIQALLNAGD